MRIAYGRADGEESGNRATFGESRRIRRHARGGRSGPSRSRLVAERHGAPGSRSVYCVAAYVAQRQERRILGGPLACPGGSRGHRDRAEESRVGKESVSSYRSRWWV